MNLNLSQSFLQKLGTRVAVDLREHIQSGKDIDGRKFKAYVASYRARKSADDFKRQSSQQVNPPDLTLTGDMLRDLQVRGVSKNTVRIGWSGVFATRVAHNEDRGRIISKKDKVFPKDIDVFIDNQFKLELDRLTAKDNKTEIVNIRL